MSRDSSMPASQGESAQDVLAATSGVAWSGVGALGESDARLDDIYTYICSAFIVVSMWSRSCIARVSFERLLGAALEPPGVTRTSLKRRSEHMPERASTERLERLHRSGAGALKGAWAL